MEPLNSNSRLQINDNNNVELNQSSSNVGSKGNRANKNDTSYEVAKSPSILQQSLSGATSSLSSKEVMLTEEVLYENDKGWAVKKQTYDKLQKLIDDYDIKPEQDVRRGASMGSADTIKIGVALAELTTYITSQRKEGLPKTLDNVIHPGAKDYTRNERYEGRSFMQIINMCVGGKECNNDLAEALRECLSTLKLSEE